MTATISDKGQDKRITCPDIDMFGHVWRAAWREQRWLDAGKCAKCLGSAGAITPSITKYGLKRAKATQAARCLTQRAMFL